MASPETLAKFIDHWSKVEAAFAQAEQPLTAAELANQFSRAKETDVQEIIDTFCALGRIRPGDATRTYVR